MQVRPACAGIAVVTGVSRNRAMIGPPQNGFGKTEMQSDAAARAKPNGM